MNAKRRTRPLLTGIELAKRSAAARQRSLNGIGPRRCDGCGGFLDVQGRCNKCQGQSVIRG